MNEIATIKQLPIITEKIKEIGENLSTRLENLNLDNLICNEETKKEIKDLRTTLGKEFKEYESQRKEIKNKIMQPYDEFNKIYEEEIKNKYQEADEILKNKIKQVESEIKHNTEVKMKEFFEEYKKSKSIIQDNYLEFHELNMKVDLSCLTKSGELVKKEKDEIKQKVDQVEKDLDSISTMQYSNEILVEYLKTKNLSESIKEVNDRHTALDAMKRIEESARETVELEQQAIEKIDEVLQAPTEEIIDGQMSIDDFGETEQVNEEIYEMTFTVKGTLTKLKELKVYLIKEGFINE